MRDRRSAREVAGGLKEGPGGQAAQLGRRPQSLQHCSFDLSKDYEGHAKDYAFSRRSMEEHWRAGYCDAVRTQRHGEVFEQPANRDGVFVFDLANDRRE